MSTNADPRWELLPHDPQAFFELNDGYDLKDLKRSYNAYIRRFKPEKFPAEFQRIRDAYEELSNELRYGQVHRSLPIDIVRFNWKESATPDLVPDDPRANAKPVELPAVEHQTLRERLANEGPKILYIELRNRQFKSPYDYFALALLSDVVGDDPTSFVRWLLAGLKAHPNEQGLFHLLRDYFYSQPPFGYVRQLLLKTAEVVPSDRFYYLTECLWDRLLRSAPFATFRDTLEACESRFTDCRVDHQMTFYLHILKGALFKADAKWIEAAFERIEECHDQLSYSAAFELDMLEFFKAYAAHRSEFLKDGGRMRALIDRTIVDYCMLDEPEADRKFFECQMRLTANSSELFKEFPVTEKLPQHVLVVWQWITS
ncbi:MAG: hypothetical protein O2955_17290 [Planctomycetota bacterium]|nr:hypothetical protein [Planctomycetota bacterium]MDA1214266.1 hypothetical protein [Planctomycetota bacterium]